MKNDDLLFNDKSEKPSVIVIVGIFTIVAFISVVIYREFIAEHMDKLAKTEIKYTEKKETSKHISTAPKPEKKPNPIFDPNKSYKIGSASYKFLPISDISNLTDYQFDVKYKGHDYLFFFRLFDLSQHGKITATLLDVYTLSPYHYSSFSTSDPHLYMNIPKGAYVVNICNVSSNFHFVDCSPILAYKDVNGIFKKIDF